MIFFDELKYIRYRLGIGKILIAIIFIHILIIVANAIIINHTVKSIKNDGILLNSAGMIRGGIQRVVKLNLEDRCKQKNIEAVDTLFEDFSLQYNNLGSKIVMKDFYEKLIELELVWVELKDLLYAYRANKSLDLKVKILEKSEESWLLSVESLNIAQDLYGVKINSFGAIFAIFFVDLFLVLFVVFLINKSIRLNLEIISSRDSLTNIGNRNRYNEAMQIYFNLFKKQNKQISYIIFDIDFFKKINDNFGHDFGDKILINITKVILSVIKKDDTFCRIGGEEFVIISENIPTKDDLEKFSNKIKTSIESFDFELGYQVTISIGATFFNENDTKDTIFKRADEALYVSKNSGRNRVTIF